MRVPPMLYGVKTKDRARFLFRIRRRRLRFLSLSFYTALEVLALRQQVGVLKRKRPRPLLNCWDRLFWLALRRFWSGWKGVLVIVKPDTVVAWHRAGFRWYWRWRSRRRLGRPKITKEVRELIRRLAHENIDWGAPKIHGELLKLGFEVSERTVARYLRRVLRRGDPIGVPCPGLPPEPDWPTQSGLDPGCRLRSTRRAKLRTDRASQRFAAGDRS
jgi:hypothetical protein